MGCAWDEVVETWGDLYDKNGADILAKDLSNQK